MLSFRNKINILYKIWYNYYEKKNGGKNMQRLILLLILSISVSSAITYLIHKITKKRFVKYIPTVIPIYFCIVSIYNMTRDLEGFTDVANFLVFLIFLTSLISILVTGSILDRPKNY